MVGRRGRASNMMRITTWNVNGLRAAMNKGILDWVKDHSPDVLCLQEVRSFPEQLDPAGLQSLSAIYPNITWNPAQRPGYSGVATFARSLPVETSLGLGDDRFDGEGRVIASRFPGFWLFNIYFPNGGRDNSRVSYKLEFYARLLDLCDDLHARGERVIICGDFNTSHRPIDLAHPKQNEKNTGFLPEEREWIDRYLEHDLVDVYRQLYPERVQYTWWTFLTKARERNVGWRLDYFLVSAGLVGEVGDVVIHDEVLGSDHCPVTLIFQDL
jgi:exodeoxyribonuclease-3